MDHPGACNLTGYFGAEVFTAWVVLRAFGAIHMVWGRHTDHGPSPTASVMEMLCCCIVPGCLHCPTISWWHAASPSSSLKLPHNLHSHGAGSFLDAMLDEANLASKGQALEAQM